MGCNKPPQRDEERLFLYGFEFVLRDALPRKPSEVAGRKQIQMMTYAVQNLDT